VIIGGETLSAHNARRRKIPRWILLICENFSVNKRALEKKVERLIDLRLVGFCLSFFSNNFTFGFHTFNLKKLKIIQHDF